MEWLNEWLGKIIEAVWGWRMTAFSVGGNYTIYNNTVFDAIIPETTLKGTQINIYLTYNNYLREIQNLEDDCEINFSDGQNGTENIWINETLSYNLSCSNPELETISQKGIISTGNIYGFEKKNVFDQFQLHYVNETINYQTDCSQLNLNTTNSYGESDGDSCYWVLDALEELSIKVRITDGDLVNYNGEFNLIDARRAWESRGHQSQFNIEDKTEVRNNHLAMFKIESSNFIYRYQLNSSGEYFHNKSITNLPFSDIHKLSINYARINLHNNNSKIEIIN